MSKILCSCITTSNSNQFTLKDYFGFAKIICKQDAGLFMASLDVQFLFTNVPLEETVHICVYELFKCNSSIHGLNKKQITEMLNRLFWLIWRFTFKLTV